MPMLATPAILLEARQLAVRYPGGALVLRDASLTVAQGRMTMILGRSGSGKTTLLRALKGLVPLEAGQAAWPAGCRLAYIPQNLGLVRGVSARANVLMGALGALSLGQALRRAFPADIRAAAQTLLQEVGLGACAETPVARLSGGERQRVAIARALLMRPDVILADEFVSQLDPATLQDILALVARLVQGGATFVITTHDVDVALRYADTVAVMREGRLVHQGPAADVTAERLLALLR